MAVRYFQGNRPSPRSDQPWNRVRISEAAVLAGPFVVLETQNLSPLDADPEDPAFRNFTTTLATLPVAVYRLVFLDAANNEDEPIYIEDPSTGYPSAGELVDDSDLTALTNLPFESQYALWLASKSAIEEYTGQTFEFEPDTLRAFDGTGDRSVYLPKRLEVITDLEVSYSSLGVADVDLHDDRNKLTVRSDAGIRNYYERAIVRIQDNPSLLFTSGVATVRVTGDWGWEEFPEAVREAMRLDMEDQALADTNALSESLRAYQKLGMRDVRQGNLTAAVTAVSGLSDRVRHLLDPYVWRGRVGAVL